MKKIVGKFVFLIVVLEIYILFILGYEGKCLFYYYLCKEMIIYNNLVSY